MKTKLTLHALFLSVLFLAACSNNENSTKEPAAIDSVKLKDSIAKADLHRIDEKKVIDDIEFGITKKEFDKKSESFKKSLQTEKDSYLYRLGNYDFTRIESSFEDLKLYKATLIGDIIHYDNYESNLIPQLETLKIMLEAKYGNPTTGDGPPAWHQTQNDYNYLAYRWIIGSKTIDVRVSDRGLYYSADLKIYQPKIEESIALRSANKDLEIAHAAKDVL